MKQNSIDIVIVGDNNVEVGLHTLLYSVLKKSSYKLHNFYFINKGFDAIRNRRLNKTLEGFKERYKIINIQFDDETFGNYSGLHGNTFVYTKLVIPELVEAKIVLYLDIDIIVNFDIKEFQQYIERMNSFLIAANVECTIKESLEKRLFESLNIPLNQNYFNTGVMLLNLDLWREFDLSHSLKEFANKNAENLKTADQTVVNAIVDSERIMKLPDSFNIRIHNNVSPKEYEKLNGIFHFFGRPKPWDLLADFVHPHYKMYKNILKETEFSEYSTYRRISTSSLLKLRKTYKSYFKALLRIK